MVGRIGDRSIKWAAVVWIAVLVVAVAIWTFIPSQVVGWDLDVISRAIASLRAGHDPYLDSILAQQDFFSHPLASPDAAPPFSYVYSPITLPLLQLIGHAPMTVAGTIYWIIYALGGLVILWLGLRLAHLPERRVFAVLAPALLFFPGLLESGILVSGNVAFPLYGCLFAGAWIGWRRRNWTWFYAAALLASCFKPPMLSVLAIPVFSERKLLLPSCLVAALGGGLFCLQPMLFPAEFKHFMQALNMMFNLQHDYSGSPAGLVAGFFYGGARFRPAFILVYLLFSLPVCWVLRTLSLRYFDGELSFRQWVPVMMLGVLLLNPRINEYDAAAVTIPMALVAWRVFSRWQNVSRAALTLSLVFLAANTFVALTSSVGPVMWKCTQCLMLLGLFWSGSGLLFSELRHHRALRDLEPAQHFAGVGLRDVLPDMAITAKTR